MKAFTLLFLLTSFFGVAQVVSNKNFDHQKHEFGIKSRKQAKFCELNDCEGLFTVLNTSVSVIGDSIYISFQKDFLPKVISSLKHKKDGIMTEVVFFDYNYSCEDIQNDLIPTRRNEMCIYNGLPTEPVYKEELLQKIQQRLTFYQKQKIKLRNDDWIRFSIGKFPEEANGERVTINLLVIKHKRLCCILEAAGVCGYPLKNTLPHILPEFEFSSDYYPQGTKDTVKFRVNFQQGLTQFDTSLVQQKVLELKRKNHRVDKAVMLAFASVEGTPENNQMLFHKRAQVVLDLFNKEQLNDIPFKLRTTENWSLFFKQIKNTDYRFLLEQDTTSIRTYVNDPKNVVDLEPMLSKQRYVIARIYTSSIINQKNEVSYAIKEFNDLIKKDRFQSSAEINHLLEIQKFIYQKHLMSNYQSELIHLPFDQSDPKFAPFFYHEIMLNALKKPTGNYLKPLEKIQKLNPKLPLLSYNLLTQKYRFALQIKDQNVFREIPQFIKALEYRKYSNDTIQQFQLYYHHAVVNDYVKNTIGGNSRIRENLLFIKDYYEAKRPEMTEDSEFILARYYFFCREFNWAMEILEPLIHQVHFKHEWYIQYVKALYFANSLGDFDNAQQEIIKSSNVLTPQEWCDLFIGPCNINFQVFENSAIRQKYCEICND